MCRCVFISLAIYLKSSQNEMHDGSLKSDKSTSWRVKLKVNHIVLKVKKDEC